MSDYTTDYNLALPTEGSQYNGQVINANTQKINDGRTHKGTLGETVAQYKVGALDEATGKIVVADASDPTKLNIVGFCTESGILDELRLFRCNGYIQNGSWALSRGKVWLDNNGDPSNTPGANKIFLGLAVTADTIWIIGMDGRAIDAGGVGVDAVVKADGSGDYTTISGAIAGENEGSTIFVDGSGGVITEVADISPKTGQSIQAFGGSFLDIAPTPPAQASVSVIMGDNKINVTNEYARMKGIAFNFTPSTDEWKVAIASNYGVYEDLFFDFDAGGNCDVLQISGIFNQFLRIGIKGAGGVREAVRCAGNYNTLRDFGIRDMDLATVDGFTISGDENTVDNIQFGLLFAGASTQYLMNIGFSGGNNNKVSNINITGMTSSISGIKVSGAGRNHLRDFKSINDGGAGASRWGLFVDSDYNIIDGGEIDGWGGATNRGVYLDGCVHNKISNLTLGRQNWNSLDLYFEGAYSNHLHNISMHSDVGGTDNFHIDSASYGNILTNIYWTDGSTIDGDDNIISAHVCQTGFLTLSATAKGNVVTGFAGATGYTPTDPNAINFIEYRTHNSPSSAPSVSIGANQGFVNNDMWVKLDTHTMWRCEDSDDPNAVWTLLEGYYPLGKSSDYTITNADIRLYSNLEVTTTATDKTMTLPSLAGNTGMEITINLSSKGAGNLIVSRAGGDTFVDGATSKTISTAGGSIRCVATSFGWQMYIT